MPRQINEERIAERFLRLERQLLDMAYFPNYKDLVARQFEICVTQPTTTLTRYAFCARCKVCSAEAPSRNCRLVRPPREMFGTDAVERGFYKNEIE